MAARRRRAERRLIESFRDARHLAMKRNRSISPVTVIPVLVYPDVRAAVDWLAAAFGFVERTRIGESRRAQLSVGVDGP